MRLKSSVYKAGTPVSFGVALSLTPTSTIVPCDGMSAANLNFGGSGVDAQGGDVDVEGECEGGVFVYRYQGTSGPVGTVDSGVLTGYIGQPLTITVDGYVETDACGRSYSCDGTFLTTLAGSVRWTITSVPAGVTYTTASGTKYQ